MSRNNRRDADGFEDRAGRAATNLLIRSAGKVHTARNARDWVALADARTSANDARAALSVACGAPLDGIHPTVGTHSWGRP